MTNERPHICQHAWKGVSVGSVSLVQLRGSYDVKYRDAIWQSSGEPRKC